MPPLVNLTRQNAEQQLNALGLNLNIQIEERKDDIYTEGYVIQTDPVSDTPLTSGQTVTLVVSLGPDIELTEVPTLVGEDVDKALQMIADAGLQNGSIRSDDSDLPAGTVTFQSIDGGQMVKKDTVINLRVSKGPEEAATPVVTNLTQDQAVLQDEQVTLSISAYASDNGTLRYAWYMSTDGGYENAALVSRSREGNTTCRYLRPRHVLLFLRRGKLPRRRHEDHQVQHDRGCCAGEDCREDHRGQSSEQKRPV